MKKVLALALSLALIATLAISSTVAYLTSEDSDVNVMTLGSVKIDQIEKERVEQTNSGKDALKDFENDKPLFPAVGEVQWVEGADGRVYQEWETGGSSALFDSNLENVVDKMVFVENTGKSEAYVRTIFAFEAGNMTAAEINNKLIHWNRNSTHWTWTDFSDDMTCMIDGEKYFLRAATYTGSESVHAGGILPKGETTRPSLLQLFLDSEATNEDIAAFGDTYEVLALSQAVQVQGFENPAQALNAGFGELTPANAEAWFDGIFNQIYEPGTGSYALNVTDATSEADFRAAVAGARKAGADSLVMTGEMSAQQQLALAKAMNGIPADSVVIVLNDTDADSIADELKNHESIKYLFDEGGFIKEGNEALVANANGLKAWAASMEKKATLMADVDLSDVDNWTPIKVWDSENPFTFDGAGHTVYGLTISGSDVGFFGESTCTIKNLNFVGAKLKTSGRSAIVSAKNYGNIENCHVKDSTIEDSYWAAGGIVGMLNSGSIKDCSITNVTVKSNGGTGGIIGVLNETSGTRNVENCHVKNCTIENTGIYGEGYCGAGIVGMINISNSTVNITGCSVDSATQLNGAHIHPISGPANSDTTLNIKP